MGKVRSECYAETPNNQRKSRHSSACLWPQDRGSRDKWILGTHWPAFLDKRANPTFSEKTCFKEWFCAQAKSIATTFLQRSTENRNWAQHRDQQILGSPAPTDASASQLQYLWLRERHRKGDGKTVGARILGSLLWNTLLEIAPRPRPEWWPCLGGRKKVRRFHP